MNSEEKQSLIKAVNEASPEGLRQFIINQAQFDPAFFQDVTAQFGDLDTDVRVCGYEKMVQATVRHTNLRFHRLPGLYRGLQRLGRRHQQIHASIQAGPLPPRNERPSFCV